MAELIPALAASESLSNCLFIRPVVRTGNKNYHGLVWLALNEMKSSHVVFGFGLSGFHTKPHPGVEQRNAGL